MSEKLYSKQSWKGSVITSPLPPTLVTCGSGDSANVLTVAWTGICCTRPPIVYISVRPERHSYGLIKSSGEFVINLPTEELTRTVDICGVKSGRDVDKFALTGLEVREASEVSAPIIAQCPVNIECRVREVIALGSHDMFLANVVAVDAADELIDEKGRLALEKARLIAYAHGQYFSLGKVLGSFGYSVRKKKRTKRK